MLLLAHKNLEVYKFSFELVKEIYQLTQSFPKEEQFVLVTQLRRAVVSICSNLAEGSARFSKAEKRRYYEMSRSSLVEIDTQVELAMVLGYFKKDDIEKLEKNMESIFKMISKMINNLKE